ncbi:MAG: serine/threonine-protein phosphatase [Lachnospiraceae bacterium]|nr:serine/threonine-protein phosphatase [Lachnospiraceae bacterium]
MGCSVNYSMITNTGGRMVNEDSIGVCDCAGHKAFVLCDGLGGHGMGDVASSLVKDVFINIFENAENIPETLSTAFRAAQDVLMAEQKRLNVRGKMKTTAVALAVDEKKAYVGFVGDSRLYIFNNNKLVKRTLDHSVPQMLVESKEISESEIRNHPDRNRLLKVMGVDWNEPMYDIWKPIPLKKCQAFLLCSDGFWELIDESKMCEMLEKAADVKEWLLMMNDEVQKNGIGKNMDNNSAIAVWCC